MSQHIHLAVHGAGGVEPVHAEPLGNNSFRVLYSPGLVLGIAAGDTIELLGDTGQFRVLTRGGNIAVQLFSSNPVSTFKTELETLVRNRLMGTCDGGIDRGLVFTIPVTSGFQSIEEVFENFVRTHPGVEWMYGNVYDPETNEPLGWWSKRA